LAAVRFRTYPISCQNVWSLDTFCFKTTTTDRTIPRSGIPRKIARKNFLQQLSVQLWAKNAKMILRYWALQMMKIPYSVVVSPVDSFSVCILVAVLVVLV